METSSRKESWKPKGKLLSALGLNHHDGDANGIMMENSMESGLYRGAKNSRDYYLY